MPDIKVTLLDAQQRDERAVGAGRGRLAAGRDDVLGRRHANVGTGGGVLPVRWME